MTVPDYQTLMRPVLEVLEVQGPQQFRSLVDLVAGAIDLTDEDRAATVPSGEPRIRNRVGWSLSYLARAGAVDRPRRGFAQLSARGKDLRAQNPERIDSKVLDQFAEFRAFRAKSSGSRSGPAVEAAANTAGIELFIDPLSTDASPQDLIQRAVAENRAVVESEILDRALAVDPPTFERLVLRLLEAMGYGKSGRIEHSGRSGDGGIDGIISQDPLGLDRVYMQAKRYARDNVVQRPAIQGFVGALLSAQGDRGVFITTSSFSSGARQEADKVNARIVLIDGDRLAELMVHHGVGVQAESTAVLHRVDEDFFDSL